MESIGDILTRVTIERIRTVPKFKAGMIRRKNKLLQQLVDN